MRQSCVLLTMLCVATLAGCAGSPGMSTGGGDSWRNAFRGEGAEWSIMCMEFREPERRSLCEQIASAVRRSRDIVPSQVYTRHEAKRSRIYYGRYWREGDRATGKFKTTPELQRDVMMIKMLTVDGSPFFIESRLLPSPTSDVGNPEWEMGRNSGVYTLRIALFYVEPGFSKRKQVAAEFCEELRKRGYEAYYRHGDITSEVFVGSFGTEALVEVRQSGVLVSVPSQEIVRLQRDELLRFELHNAKSLTWTEGGKKWNRASRVVPVHDELEENFDEYEY